MGTMELKRTEAAAMFEMLGYKTAKKWDKAQTEKNLSRLNDTATLDSIPADADPEAAKTFKAVLSALGKGDTIALVNDVAKPAADAPAEALTDEQATVKGDAEGPAPTSKKAAKKTAKKATTAKATTTKAAPKKAAKKAAPKKAATPKEPKEGQGIRLGWTRPYCAGLLMKKYVDKAGGKLPERITPAMVEELNKLYGKQNDMMSRWYLTECVHLMYALSGEGPKTAKAAAAD